MVIRQISPISHLTHVCVSAFRAKDGTVCYRTWIRPVLGVAITGNGDTMDFVVQNPDGRPRGKPVLYRSLRHEMVTSEAIVESHPDRIENKVEMLRSAALEKLMSLEGTQEVTQAVQEPTLANRVRMRSKVAEVVEGIGSTDG